MHTRITKRRPLNSCHQYFVLLLLHTNRVDYVERFTSPSHSKSLQTLANCERWQRRRRQIISDMLTPTFKTLALMFCDLSTGCRSNWRTKQCEYVYRISRYWSPLIQFQVDLKQEKIPCAFQMQANFTCTFKGVRHLSVHVE